MDNGLFKDRMKKFEGACRQLDAVPEVLFARGIVAGRPTLLFLSGPRLNLDSLKQLRTDIIEVLDAKENQLKGGTDPNVLNVSF